jgi:uncharacterized phage protein (TIGR01671 family)
MRPIKFRVWDKQKSQFVEDDLLFEQGEEDGETSSIRLVQRKLDRYHGYIIQQYTGLKDKNGKDVYEGDIIKVFWLDMEPYNAKVRWDTYETGWYPKGVLTTKHEQVSFEVIGNIFQNPKLLKQ